MPLEAFSTVLVIGSIAVFSAIVALAAAYAALPRVRALVMGLPYRGYMATIAAIVIAASMATIVFQLIYDTPVCELCWWQRIFLYPIAIIAPVAFWYRSRGAHIMIALLSALGMWYALYHYYYHFQRFVLGNVLGLPCSYGGLMPACTDSPILIFGFATIPFLSIMVFGTMLVLCVFAHFSLRNEKVNHPGAI